MYYFGSFSDKTKEIWWKKLFQHETEIDTTKIDCSRSMDELSEETQAHINQIQFDEQQKLKGINNGYFLHQFLFSSILSIHLPIQYRSTDIGSNKTTGTAEKSLGCRRLTVQGTSIRSKYCSISDLTSFLGEKTNY